MSVSTSKLPVVAGMFITVLIATVLNSLSLMYVNAILALPAIALIFYFHLKFPSRKHHFISGVLFGSLSSFILNYWMVPVVADYAKGNIVLGIICYLASAIVLGVFFGTQFYIAGLLKYQEGKRGFLLMNVLIYAAIWVSFELIRSHLFSAMPWLSYTTGITLGRSLYLIQPAAFGGVFILSFILLVAACFVAFASFYRQWKLLIIPAAIIALQFFVGFFLYKDTQDRTIKNNPEKLSVALILPGLSPETVWNEASADALVTHLFTLNKAAVAKKPDMILWTETVVPWTYAPDDDFLKEIANETLPGNIYTLMGMNSAVDTSAKALCNSVYLLNPLGKETGRYDKQDLLTMVEKPLLTESGSLILPFLSSFGLQMRAGDGKKPIETPWGKAGIMVCNESTNASLAGDLAKEGAGYLVNIGNNNWFSDHFITRQHFYNCRLRAVETRKDLIINNNMGICGLIRGSGEIVVQKDGKKSNIVTAEVYPNQITPGNPLILVFVIAFILLFAIINQLKNILIQRE